MTIYNVKVGFPLLPDGLELSVPVQENDTVMQLLRLKSLSQDYHKVEAAIVAMANQPKDVDPPLDD